MWVQRVTHIIRAAIDPVLVEGNLYGISEVADSLISADGKVLWIEADENHLELLRSNAWGVPVDQHVGTLDEALRLHSEIMHVSLRPTVILTRAENIMADIKEVLSNRSTDHRIVISGSESATRELALLYPECALVDSAQLRVQASEARDKFGRRDIKEDWAALLDSEVAVSYEELCKAAYARLGMDLPAKMTPMRYNTVPACVTKSGDGLVKLLSNNRHWKRALDVALATRSEDLFEVIDLVGEDALLHNELEPFRRKLSALPVEMRNTAEVLYWLLLAEHQLGIRSDLELAVQHFLQYTDCPRLRTLMVTLGLSEGVLADDSPGCEYQDPILAVYRAHLLSFGESRGAALPRLHRMVRFFRSAGRDYRLVQSMSILSNALTLDGKFHAAAHWGIQARDLALELGLGDYGMVMTTGPAAYALTLTGDWSLASEMLSHVHSAESYVGLPFAEGTLSTIADQFSVAGHFDTALKWYETVAENFRGPSSDIVIPDVALMLVRLGKSGDALRRVRTRLAGMNDDTPSRPWLELAQAIALSGTDPLHAEDEFKSVLRNHGSALPAPFKVRAILMLATLVDRVGMREAALELFDSECHALLELGSTGWQLLSGRDSRIDPLRDTWVQARAPLEVNFLVSNGNWRFRNSSSETVRSKRFKELLFVLSCFPDGIRGEYLTELLGWGALGPNTLRSHIRRLRTHVPIDGRPYRLGVQVSADYLEVREAIGDGDLRNALKLYAGPLLRESDAPFVREQRMDIESQLRMLVLDQGTPEETAGFALKLGDDLELLEFALGALDEPSSLRTRVETQIRMLRGEWEISVG